ncbi:MAG TPA: molybdopterin converting factor subunit 1 [Aestuariivirga sp.]|jgi:molybdopterin synthase sulfur carrier subunit|nr:molybdopterin converting factor subunit 1 [Aestuariivirga sp.]
MKVLYFARFRQALGRGGDDIAVPAGVTTVRGLLDHLKATDAGCAAAFADARLIRVAVDQTHASLETDIAGAREVAFFPPVTGG